MNLRSSQVCLVILLSMVGLVLGTNACWGTTYIVDDNFDSETVGSVPSGWYESNSSFISGRVSELFAKSPSNSLKVQRHGYCDNNVYHKLFLPPGQQIITFEYDVLVPSSGHSRLWSFSLHLGGKRKLSIQTTIDDGNVHRIRYGSTSFTVLGNYIPETWNTIKIVFDTETEVGEVYYNDEFISIADGDDSTYWNCGLPDPFFADGDWFGVHNDCCASGLVYIDNVKVYYEEEVPIDIKPGSCPNPLNVKSKGILPMAILGTGDFDVYEIDVASIRLEGISPIRSGYEDVATPFEGEPCDCHELGADGYVDLTLKFETQALVEVIGEVNDGDEVILTVSGKLSDETDFEGVDCVKIIKKEKK